MPSRVLRGYTLSGDTYRNQPVVSTWLTGGGGIGSGRSPLFAVEAVTSRTAQGMGPFSLKSDGIVRKAETPSSYDNAIRGKWNEKRI